VVVVVDLDPVLSIVAAVVVAVADFAPLLGCLLLLELLTRLRSALAEMARLVTVGTE
jgi:hypothetical protein